MKTCCGAGSNEFEISHEKLGRRQRLNTETTKKDNGLGTKDAHGQILKGDFKFEI
jgi:hypothetical protein